MLDKKLLYLTQELTALENQYIFALNAAGVGIWTWNIKTDELTWDARMMKLFETGKEEFTKDLAFFKKVIIPEDLPHVLESIDNCIKSGIPYDVSFRIKLKNGAMKIIRGKGQVMRDEVCEAKVLAGICFEESPYCPRYSTCEIRKAIQDGDQTQLDKYISAIKSAMI